MNQQRHPAGAPASVGGRFAPDAAPDAATALACDPVVTVADWRTNSVRLLDEDRKRVLAGEPPRLGYLRVERDGMRDALVAYPSTSIAAQALHDDPFIDGLAEENCLDLRTTTPDPADYATGHGSSELIIADLEHFAPAEGTS